MNRNRRDLTRRFLPKFFLLPYGTLPKAAGVFFGYPGEHSGRFDRGAHVLRLSVLAAGLIPVPVP